MGKQEIDMKQRWPVFIIFPVIILFFSSCAVLSEQETARAPESTPAPAPSTNDTAVSDNNVSPYEISRGTVDTDFQVDIYQPDLAWPGTTLLADNHNPGNPRIIEVNMLGEIVWEYPLPSYLKKYTNPGFDAELLPDDNILFLLPGSGVYEIDRKGNNVWSYLTMKISHDADRLPDGNTIFVFGGNDRNSDAQVIEVNQAGEVVWSWYAADYFDKPPYMDIYDYGWTHTNAVTRLSNGNTLISLRNFNFIAEVDTAGSVVRTIGEGVLEYQHDPEVLSSGNILLANHVMPHRAIEIDPETGKVVWESRGFGKNDTPVRDADRLPNGNTLITCATRIVEITEEGEIVWQFSLTNPDFETPGDKPARGFYKAQRIGKNN